MFFYVLTRDVFHADSLLSVSFLDGTLSYILSLIEIDWCFLIATATFFNDNECLNFAFLFQNPRQTRTLFVLFRDLKLNLSGGRWRQNLGGAGRHQVFRKKSSNKTFKCSQMSLFSFQGVDQSRRLRIRAPGLITMNDA